MGGTERPVANYISQAHDTAYSDILMNLYVLHPSAEISLWKNVIFLAQMTEYLFSLAQCIIAGLIVVAEIEINHYFFLIASIIAFIFIFILHCIGVIEWQQQPAYSHTHLTEIFFSFFKWIILSVANMVMLGVWLMQKDDSSCCGFSDSQPTKVPPYSTEYTQFIVIYGAILINNLILLTVISRALIAHYYPEFRFNPPRYLSDITKET
jgi:hypothetical protein